MNLIKYGLIASAMMLAVPSMAAPAKAAPKTAKASLAANQDNEEIKIVEINDSNFEKEIMYTDKPTILDVSSTSCPPCLIMLSTLIDIARNYPDIKVATINFDGPNIQKIKNTLPIQAFPTFFFIKDGKIINRIAGAVGEEDLLNLLQYTPKPNAKVATKSASKKNFPKSLTCSVDGEFGGLKNHVTIKFDFGKEQIDNVDIVTDVFLPPELESHREDILNKFRASGKGEVVETMTGLQSHIANDSHFMKAMNMKRNSSYGEMKAGLEMQGYKCK